MICFCHSDLQPSHKIGKLHCPTGVKAQADSSAINGTFFLVSASGIFNVLGLLQGCQARCSRKEEPQGPEASQTSDQSPVSFDTFPAVSHGAPSFRRCLSAGILFIVARKYDQGILMLTTLRFVRLRWL